MTYTLKNNKYCLEINSLGAELKSSKFTGEEYLHIGDVKYWNRSSPVLFPIVGKLKENKYTYKNKEYFLTQHGFARGLEFELIKESSSCLTFLLVQNEKTLKVYPFKFNLKIKYVLEEEGFYIRYEVSSEEKILFSLGAHPAFLLKADICDSYLEFEKKEKKDLIGLDLQSACVSYTKKNYLDSNVIQLKDDIFKDDALIFEALTSKTVSLKNTKNQKNVSVSCDSFSHIAFWAPIGAPFVCIEPWCGHADDINTKHNFEDKKALLKLQKNEVIKKEIFICFR